MREICVQVRPQVSVGFGLFVWWFCSREESLGCISLSLLLCSEDCGRLFQAPREGCVFVVGCQSQSWSAQVMAAAKERGASGKLLTACNSPIPSFSNRPLIVQPRKQTWEYDVFPCHRAALCYALKGGSSLYASLCFPWLCHEAVTRCLVSLSSRQGFSKAAAAARPPDLCDLRGMFVPQQLIPRTR